MELDNATIILILYCVLAFSLAFFPAHFIFPKFIRKMKSLGNTGKDVNKRGNIQVAEPQASEARCGRGRAELVSAQKTSSEVFQGAEDLDKLDRSSASGGIIAVFSFSLAMFVIQEEATARRRWKRSDSDWMISPTTVGDCSSPVWLLSPMPMRT